MKKKNRLLKFLYKKKKNNFLVAKIFIFITVLSVPILFGLFISLPLYTLTLRPLHPLCGAKLQIPTYTWDVPVTAYSSTADQTDSTPFATANGTTVHWGVVATNFLPFKTCIKFPDAFGDQWFVVEDRKHERFSESIDIWFPTREEAKTFGFRTLRMEIWK